MTKEFTMRMPDDIHTLLMRIKQQFRISMNSKIMGYIARGLISDGYYPISNLISVANSNHTLDQTETEAMPEGVKFCDGNSCEIPLYHNHTSDGMATLIPAGVYNLDSLEEHTG